MGLVKLVVFSQYEGVEVVITKDIKLPYEELYDNFMGFVGENVIMDVQDLLDDIEKFKEHIMGIKKGNMQGWQIGEGIYSDRHRTGLKKRER